MAVDSTSVYWVNYGSNNGTADGTVMKAPLGGGTATQLAGGQISPRGIAVDSTGVYFASSTAVLKVGLGGGTVTTIVPGQDWPGGLVVDSTSIYWTNSVNNGAVMKATPK